MSSEAIGLSLTFLRQQGQNFPRNSQGESPSDEPGSLWHVWGTSDYLYIRTIKSLNELSFSRTAREVFSKRSGARLTYNVFPIDEKSIVVDNFECQFLLVISYVLSAVTHECWTANNPNKEKFESLLGRVRDRIKTELTDFDNESYQTLGGADLLSIVHIDSQYRFREIMGCISALRRMTCEEGGEHGRHLFASINASLCTPINQPISQTLDQQPEN